MVRKYTGIPERVIAAPMTDSLGDTKNGRSTKKEQTTRKTIGRAKWTWEREGKSYFWWPDDADDVDRR